MQVTEKQNYVHHLYLVRNKTSEKQKNEWKNHKSTLVAGFGIMSMSCIILITLWITKSFSIEGKYPLFNVKKRCSMNSPHQTILLNGLRHRFPKWTYNLLVIMGLKFHFLFELCTKHKGHDNEIMDVASIVFGNPLVSYMTQSAMESKFQDYTCASIYFHVHS